MSSSSWQTLPSEMQMAVVEILDVEDARRFARVDKHAYAACVPRTFEHVKLNGWDALRSFVDSVPKEYCRHIRQLDVSTACHNNARLPNGLRTQAVASLLSTCPRLQRLSMRLAGSLDKSVIPYFGALRELTQLSITNDGPEEVMPISERLVVSIAASLPSLADLSLNGISRSTLHAPELVGTYSNIPLVCGDSDIPSHPIFGAALNLPSLLRLPTLKRLAIHNTHLGDPQWSTVGPACVLDALELGSCMYDSPESAERIMVAIGPSVAECALGSGLRSAAPVACRKLRKLSITSSFPVDDVAETMTTLSDSPIECLALHCFEDDAPELCASVEAFLNTRVERGPTFYEKLARVELAVTPVDAYAYEERMQATEDLMAFCWDLGLATTVVEVPADERVPQPCAVDTKWSDACRGVKVVV
ncbi:hypothetical protein PLICRDRAFT_105875 [Plicaturopsis crispa FD-325 SS-3]|nr:hypothetical protein PLICRDRAFT_105875 [Plicaturopsis crispa FD-325 SS-3]